MFVDVHRDDRELRLVLRADTTLEHEALRQVYHFMPAPVSCSIYQEKSTMPVVTNVTIHFPRQAESLRES